jgi:sensitive to high expression protein 9
MIFNRSEEMANRSTEKLVKARLEAVQLAKDGLEVARAQESSSRKEVVGLLERKHAWSDADLERYMNLIRSEHLNDQGIQAAKDKMAAAEMALEESRTRLEKRERMQYHEEQIWSDTIRRNSTWVTFGLMGLNIFLLLATLILIEPWRRRRLVKEIRKTLEENQPTTVAFPLIAEAIDAVVEPKGVSLETLEATFPQQSAATKQIEVAPVNAASPNDNEAKLLDVPETIAAILSDPLDPSVTEPALEPWSIEYCRGYFNDLFSEQRITLRMVDVTTIALEGAAAGAAIVGLLIVLLRPK